MCEPHKHTDNARGAILEASSAISSLHMPPCPMDDNTGTGFLSYTDKMASHSIEHMNAAIICMVKVEKTFESVRDRIWQFILHPESATKEEFDRLLSMLDSDHMPLYEDGE